jgi:hypothetical protein
MESTVKYDIAISFADEDRNAALAIALALKAKGFQSVYYYPDELHQTIGQPLEKKITSIYSTGSKFVIVLLSDAYAQKGYTQIELEAIRARMKNNPDQVFMLPVLVTDKIIDKYPDLAGIGYLEWNYDPKKIAKNLKRIFTAGSVSQLKNMAGKKWTQTIIQNYNFTKKVTNIIG